ncbi:chemotaxis protein CheX [Bacillus shivajii]|uniref:chemotaxis protein CheX n=1 Tax=Bacillus shivajii TaxID=1983719 RepID=UPI001CFC3DB4|nr:chemotaxis protein CheX [Bacillus shivajii]UCZ52866.1 chemotaxis protein CheX [Bacillus shivajii]
MIETIVKNKYDDSLKESIDGMVQSVKDVIPIQVEVNEPTLTEKPYYLREIGVLIGITGDLNGQVLIEGETSTFGLIAQGMFGSIIEGEMLESFIAELGNMISGNMATSISLRDIRLDISPPAVISGNSKFTAFNHAVKIPINVTSDETINIIMMMKREAS